MIATFRTPLSATHLSFRARCTVGLIAGLMALPLLLLPLRGAAQTAAVSPPSAQAQIPAEWLREFEAGVPDKTKMEWMQKAPEKVMAYMRWQKEEQARLDAANAKGKAELEQMRAANEELRRVAEGLGKITAPCKASSDGRCP